jgi:DNA-directed RNA polymerase subunit RPC12/RpoP
MKGYNLPDNISPNDPNAPWNKDEQEEEVTCIICGKDITEEEQVWRGDEAYCVDCSGEEE